MKIMIFNNKVYIFVNGSFISMSYEMYKENWK